MEHVFSVQAIVCVYHYYKAIWDAAIDEEVLSCERKVENVHDMFAVAVKKMESSNHLWLLSKEDFFSPLIFIRREGLIIYLPGKWK